MRKILMYLHRYFIICSILTFPSAILAQVSFPVNGVAEPPTSHYAFTHATIVKDANSTLKDASMVVKNGKIVAIGNDINIPVDATVIDCRGKFIYPSFIDAYSDYGIPVPQRAAGGFNFNAPSQITSNAKGAYGWNQAIRSDIEGYKIFSVDKSKAEQLRNAGFGTVLTHQKDGIARGTGSVVTLASEKENLVMIKERASSHYSFSKGISTQSYPGSIMGTIALLRQTYIDAAWYRSNPDAEGVNISLQSWNENSSLPQIFEANDKWNDIRADRIGDEFNVQYIIKGGGNEYQRIKEVAATKATYILPLDFPQAMDVEDPNESRFVSLSDLKHWEMAPSNPAAFEKAGIPFCLTAADLTDTKQFLTNLRKSVEYGLSETKALEALTKVPANMLGIYGQVGSLEAGKLANFFISNDEIFDDKSVILQNWVQGKKYAVKEESWNEFKAAYKLTVTGSGNSSVYTMELKPMNVANIIGADTLKGKYSYDGKLVKISFPASQKSKLSVRLSGVVNDSIWNGTGEDSVGRRVTWEATYLKPLEVKSDSAKKKNNGKTGEDYYPFS